MLETIKMSLLAVLIALQAAAVILALQMKFLRNQSEKATRRAFAILNARLIMLERAAGMLTPELEALAMTPETKEFLDELREMGVNRGDKSH